MRVLCQKPQVGSSQTLILVKVANSSNDNELGREGENRQSKTDRCTFVSASISVQTSNKYRGRFDALQLQLISCPS